MIDLKREGDVFILHLNSGENRFNEDSVAEINRALDEAEAAEGNAALVSVGEGKYYSNGLDLDYMMALEGAATAEFIGSVLELLARVLEFPMATVAAMQGHAFAGGGMLALAHDYRIMRADRGYFCLPEVDLQMPLQPGMTKLIAGRLPVQTAHEAIVTGKRYGGEEALSAGIVQQALPLDEVLPAAVELAQGLAAKPRNPMRVLKQGLYEDALAALRSSPLVVLP
jgi:enoyl-CoA hydratase/carnithine racemase